MANRKKLTPDNYYIPSIIIAPIFITLIGIIIWVFTIVEIGTDDLRLRELDYELLFFLKFTGVLTLSIGSFNTVSCILNGAQLQAILRSTFLIMIGAAMYTQDTWVTLGIIPMAGILILQEHFKQKLPQETQAEQ